MTSLRRPITSYQETESLRLTDSCVPSDWELTKLGTNQTGNQPNWEPTRLGTNQTGNQPDWEPTKLGTNQTGNQPNWEPTRLGTNQTGNQPNWEPTKLGTNQTGNQPNWEPTKLGTNQTGNQPNWEPTRLGTNQTGNQPDWELTKLGTNQTGNQPNWEPTMRSSRMLLCAATLTLLLVSVESGVAGQRTYTYDLSGQDLTDLYNKKVYLAEKMRRPFGSSSSAFGPGSHSGVRVTLEDGSRWLIHKGDGYGISSQTVVTNADYMSSNWELKSSWPSPSTRNFQGRKTVGDFVRVGGESYKLFSDNCHQAADRMINQ